VNGIPYTHAVDWWSIGVLIFELRKDSLSSDTSEKVYKKIQLFKIKWQPSDWTLGALIPGIVSADLLPFHVDRSCKISIRASYAKGKDGISRNLLSVSLL
jgi:hypothetical protein